MDDTWFDRELPVLDAIVRIHDRTGRGLIKADAIERECGLDKDAVQQALRALATGPYFDDGVRAASGGIVLGVTQPTGEARRAVGAWPSGEILAQRLVAALESAAGDTARPEEERGRIKQAAAWIGGLGYQVAVGALGGAGGNMLNG